MGTIPIRINQTDKYNLKLAERTNHIQFGFYDKVEAAGGIDEYEGPYVVTPKAWEEIILDTDYKLMKDDVTVLEIPYYETSNVSGLTAYIG